MTTTARTTRRQTQDPQPRPAVGSPEFWETLIMAAASASQSGNHQPRRRLARLLATTEGAALRLHVVSGT